MLTSVYIFFFTLSVAFRLIWCKLRCIPIIMNDDTGRMMAADTGRMMTAAHFRRHFINADSCLECADWSAP
jgi:hypothetical protein